MDPLVLGLAAFDLTGDQAIRVMLRVADNGHTAKKTM